MTDGTVGDRAAAVYAEPARSYRSVAYSVGGIVLGYLLDLLLTGPSGAVTHLPGWLVLGGLLVAVHVLVVYAARVTKSLTLTDDELRVGDEAVTRSEIEGLGGEASIETPVLGWPGGMPRGVRSVVLRLATGGDVIVPTRFPDRLTTAIGVRKSSPRAAELPRAATEDDLLLLPEIDERAEAVFRVAGYDLPRIPFDVEGLDAAAAVFVVGNPAVGFAVVDVVDDNAHLAELGVLPGSMRQGLGTALVTAVCSWAREHGHSRLTLVTYADIAWNGPFYRRQGFEELPFAELGSGLRRRRERQTELGLDAVGRRIVMQRVV